MSQTAYSEETRKAIEKEQPIINIVAMLPEFSSVVAENSCSPALIYNNKTRSWEIEFGFQGEQDRIIDFLERIRNLNISGIDIDTDSKKILADNVSTVKNLIETYINENPDQISPEDMEELHNFYKEAVSKLDGKKAELSKNQQSLIQMVVQLPINQMIAGRYSIIYQKSKNEPHKIMFTPEYGEAEQELKLFFSRIESLKIDGISSNDMTLIAEDMSNFERLIESYIEYDPVQIGGDKIAEITDKYLAYKSDKLEEIKDELTRQNNGEPVALDFHKYTPYPRTTYALYRGFETLLAHYGSEVNNFSNPEDVYSIAWNITEDESYFFIFIDLVEGETIDTFKQRATSLTEQLLHLAAPSVTMQCDYLAEPSQYRIQITSADITDIKNIIRAYYDSALITQNPKGNESFSYLKTSFIDSDSPEIITAQALLTLPTKPLLTAKDLDIDPQPITIDEIEGIMASEIENKIEKNTRYNPQLNAH